MKVSIDEVSARVDSGVFGLDCEGFSELTVPAAHFFFNPSIKIFRNSTIAIAASNAEVTSLAVRVGEFMPVSPASVSLSISALA